MRLLLVDNEGDLLDRILSEIDQLYIVDVAHNSESGEYLSEINEYDAVVVGPTLSDLEGVELCKNTRILNPTVPIAAIPLESNPEKRTIVLNSGADVCMNYPVDGKELDAQLKALIRRNSLGFGSVLKVGNVSLDYSKKTVRVRNSLISLRKKEYELLEYLFLCKGSVVTKEKILEHVWDKGIYIFSNTVEVHMRNLRLALKKHKASNVFKTVKGFGYMVKA